ncbi:hypothetical protein IVB46_01000 [Bradyrhizobium sp. 61]|uniref:hypothetical protein n=1 Tax=unclassified Bradyrhizobium TaxID=2631580 RepID=UPI001FFC0820|nr:MULTISPECIES: hypothetical protein [unclassified Bradyrhizobium]MCK1273821.1 hypothetical protein [Bradyrhizobium sp. 61]MCK1448021.1 hypothetical protein [Bradyrhizobium sp. 48]
MSLTDINDITTQRMIEACRSRNATPDVDSVALALLDARFRAFEINMRIDAVIAGVRDVTRNVTLPVLDVA